MKVWMNILGIIVMLCSESNTMCVTVMLCTLNVHSKMYTDGL